MYETIDGKAKAEIIRQIEKLDTKIAYVNHFHCNGVHRYDTYERRDTAFGQFDDLDRLLRSIYTPSAVAWLYTEAVTKIATEKDKVSLTKLTNAVRTYQKG